jgi:methionyl-tRNA formyltransferase
MKISFYGSTVFSLEILKALHELHNQGLLDLAYVVSQPAKPFGRKKILTNNIVAAYAIEHGIKLYTPDRLKDLFTEGNISSHSLDTDITIVAAYGKIISKSVLNTAKYGFLNFHGSILPKYRGAIPVQLSIMNGDQVGGVTVIRMDEGMDTGDMLLTREAVIPANTTSGELMEMLAKLSADIVVNEFSTLFDPSKWQLVPQQHDNATYCYVKDFTKELLQVNYSDGINNAHGKIMAANPAPVAWFILETDKDDSELNANLLRSQFADISELSGLIKTGKLSLHTDITKKHLYLELFDGFLEITQIQPQGKNVMDGNSFINGNLKLLNIAN